MKQDIKEYRQGTTMKRLSLLMLNARRRSIDMMIQGATMANDNAAIENLRQQRIDIGREAGRIIFQPCISQALETVRRSK